MNQKLMRLATLSALLMASVAGSVCQAAGSDVSGNLFQLVELPGMSSSNASVTIAAAKDDSDTPGEKTAKAENQHCGSKGLCKDKAHCQHCGSALMHKGKDQHINSTGKAANAKCGTGACGGKATPGQKP